MTGGFRWLARLTAVLALCVVMLGAYVRLSDAGLGCPDWPGCYGRLVVPEHPGEVAPAYSGRALEPHKAWKEMVHRYFAGTLGLFILALAVIAWRHRRRPGQPVVLPLLLVGLVVFQALLGMWTVTLQLKPVVVMAHLLGGMATLAGLWWLVLRSIRWRPDAPAEALAWRGFALLGLLLVIAQIALGGWTSANYAALACPDFPVCQGSWWPPMDFREAFVLWRGTGINYEFGVLDNPARTAIHVTHRLGALTVAIYVGLLAFFLLRWGNAARVRRAAAGVALLLLVQLGLGISNVVFRLPLPVAVAHNGGAALLLLALLTTFFLTRNPRRFAAQGGDDHAD